MPLEVRATSCDFGAEIVGLYLTRLLFDYEVTSIERAFNTHWVLIFRIQILDAQQLVQFSS